MNKGFNVRRAIGISIGILGLILTTTCCFAASPQTKSTDQYMAEARQKVAEKDYASAAVLYQKAIKLDQENHIARRELKEVLLESRRQDPEAEFSDAEWALMQGGGLSSEDALSETSMNPKGREPRTTFSD